MKHEARTHTSSRRSDLAERCLADEIRIADREVASGHYIGHEDMKAWLTSWGTEDELAPPKCACGHHHSKI
jgi:predicted transcriptional regulator